MKITGKDVLSLRKMYIGNFCNGWCISHFFHYIVLSYVSPKFWYSLDSTEIEEDIFRYKLKKFGHCVAFKKRGKYLNH